LLRNKSDRPQSVRFTGSALDGRRAKALYEIHTARVQDDSLADDFSAFGAHLYKIK